jgi:enolase
VVAASLEAGVGAGWVVEGGRDGAAWGVGVVAVVAAAAAAAAALLARLRLMHWVGGSFLLGWPVPRGAIRVVVVVAKNELLQDTTQAPKLVTVIQTRATERRGTKQRHDG